MIITTNIYKCDICGAEFDEEIDINGNVFLNHPETGDHAYIYSSDVVYRQICSKCSHKINKFIMELKFGRELPDEITMEKLETICKE